MTKEFKVTGIKWETDGAEVELPTSVAVLEAEDIDDIADALSEKYGWLVLEVGDVEELPTARVVKQWRNNFKKEVIHPEISITEAKEICSGDDTMGEDKDGPWSYFWYKN